MASTAKWQMSACKAVHGPSPVGPSMPVTLGPSGDLPGQQPNRCDVPAAQRARCACSARGPRRSRAGPAAGLPPPTPGLARRPGGRRGGGEPAPHLRRLNSPPACPGGGRGHRSGPRRHGGPPDAPRWRWGGRGQPGPGGPGRGVTAGSGAVRGEGEDMAEGCTPMLNFLLMHTDTENRKWTESEMEK